LLLASVLVVAGARRLGLPPILGYLAVGLLVGPHALGFMDDSNQTHLLSEIGVVFLLFTLGLEFSWPRMVALRREVFCPVRAQMALTTGAFSSIGMLVGLLWLVALVVGGALSMCSTAIVIRQLTEQAEINRTHGRLALSILLFQDLAFVLLLAMATLIVDGPSAQVSGTSVILRTLGSGLVALL